MFGNVASHADRSTSSWQGIPEAGSQIGIYGATFSEGLITIYPSFVMGSQRINNVASSYDFICDSANDPKCETKDFPGVAHMLIPPCEVDATSMCIEGLSLGKEGSLEKATFSRLVKSKKVEGNLSANLSRISRCTYFTKLRYKGMFLTSKHK